MVIAANFPYDTSDDETEGGARRGTTIVSDLGKQVNLSSEKIRPSLGTAQEVSQEVPLDESLLQDRKRNDERWASNHSITTAFTSRHGFRGLFEMETPSTVDEESYDEQLIHGTKSSPSIMHGRIYEKSGRRVRRARRKRIYISFFVMVGVVIMIISISVGIRNKNSTNKTSYKTSPSVNAPRDPAPPVGESPHAAPAVPTSSAPSCVSSFPAPTLNPTILESMLSPPPMTNPEPVVPPPAFPVAIPTATPVLHPGLSPTASPSESPLVAPSVATPTAFPVSSPVAPSTLPTLPPDIYNPGNTSTNAHLQAVVLASNRFLERGNSVASPSGDYNVGLDLSGNFILEDRRLNVIWSAGISGGDRVYMQSDGNLILRDANGKALWTSRTYGNEGAVLIVDDSGRIAVMHDDNTVWLNGKPRGVYTSPASDDLAFPARGIFYYPWFPETWTVNGQPVKFEADLGLYSSSDPFVARTHVDAMDYAHIDLSIASWWGPDTNLDRARLTMLMDETVQMNSNLKWSVYHEGERELKPSPYQLRRDLDYLQKWFAWHPAWAHVDGRPVIFVFNGGGCDVVNRWMDASSGDWYVVLKIFSKFWECPRQPDSWHQYGVNSGKPLQYDDYSFSIAPGFWRADRDNPETPRVSREQWCENADRMSKSDEDWHLIISFNEAGEGTNIEPSPHWASETQYGYYLDCLHQYPTQGKS